MEDHTPIKHQSFHRWPSSARVRRFDCEICGGAVETSHPQQTRTCGKPACVSAWGLKVTAAAQKKRLLKQKMKRQEGTK